MGRGMPHEIGLDQFSSCLPTSRAKGAREMGHPAFSHEPRCAWLDSRGGCPYMVHLPTWCGCGFRQKCRRATQIDDYSVLRRANLRVAVRPSWVAWTRTEESDRTDSSTSMEMPALPAASVTAWV
jgi:hypothetical protein